MQQAQDISHDAYHALPGVTNSKLKDFIDDPRVYYHKHLSGQYRQERAGHFDFGTAVHSIALLGDAANIAVIPNDVLSKSGSRSGSAWKEWEQANRTKEQLKQHEYDAVMRCVDALYAHPLANKLLTAEGVCEKMFQYTDHNYELTLRCKPDKLATINDTNIVVDLKTTGTATTPASFAKTVANFRYNQQAYFYQKVLAECGVKTSNFIFIAVSTTEPHTVDCYTLSDDFIELARQRAENALYELSERHRANNWLPKNHSEVVELCPPSYLKYQAEYEL